MRHSELKRIVYAALAVTSLVAAACVSAKEDVAPLPSDASEAIDLPVKEYKGLSIGMVVRHKEIIEPKFGIIIHITPNHKGEAWIHVRWHVDQDSIAHKAWELRERIVRRKEGQ